VWAVMAAYNSVNGTTMSEHPMLREVLKVDLKTTGHLTLDPDPDDATLTVHVSVRNTGPRPGREVVHVYASRPDSTLARPPRWLAGFALADAAPGETTTVDVVVRARSLAHWDVESEAWRIEPGSFTLTAGPLDTALPSGEAAS
jgi:hypothetical protein